MTSQETINFIRDVIKNILTKWDTIPHDVRDNMKDELISVFISFVGESRKPLENKQVIGIYVNKRFLPPSILCMIWYDGILGFS